jgi:hypothetical protein
VSFSLTSPHGSRQAVMMVTRSGITWTEQIAADYDEAVVTAFCGQSAPPAAARSLAATTLPSLQRLP